MILYLHGFRSSPASFKSTLMAQTLRAAGRLDEFICPQLPASPKLAIELCQQLLTNVDTSKLTIIGSSLGGFYATFLAEQYGCRAVLLNPAVKPPRDLSSYVGVTTMYHSDEVFEFKQEYVAELPLFSIDHITHPERYFLIAATGDEVLDWQEMVAHYPRAKQHIIQGSDHGIADFANYIDDVLAFCDAS
ncbi:YqiA/YcfP family alpha/beta fold hydrolase [Sapientia aquatica]|uniref:Esterase n=1 Tax=Sapientia aquatica TaxID=1549640 RepID=A0A4R5VZF8_9BURK|nr:YqiA/YcfP family alpha/beta fold hydrolase [Sapientia aquatica]TDK64551.1 esterase [Sapientia aquatica]